MRRKRNSGIKKERIIMIATAAFALTALTMTGIFVNSRSGQKNQDGYTVDLSSLDEDTSRQIKAIEDEINKQVAQTADDDLDVEINYEETAAEDVRLPAEDISQLNESELEKAVKEQFQSSYDEVRSWSDRARDGRMYTEADSERELEEADPFFAERPKDSLIAEDENASADEAPKIESSKTLSFAVEEGLAWPVTGNVLINYSMDNAVYFKTLNQYRYNPSMVIEAVVGEPISAAADGKVLSIQDNVETGGTIRFDLGNGYELTYGQIGEFTVKEGDYVARGQVIGYVAEPSIFYAQEGSNVYFKLTKDGEPVDPMTMMQ